MFAKKSSESQLYDEQNTEHEIMANISRKWFSTSNFEYFWDNLYK